MHGYCDVVVAGAGVIGASIGYHLAAEGHKVAVLDAKGPAAAASGACDGAVSVCSKKPGIMTRLAEKALECCDDLSRPGRPLSGSFRKRPSYYFSASDVEDQALDALVDRLGRSDGTVTVASDRQGADVQGGFGGAVRRVVEVAGEGHMLGYAAVAAFLRAHTIDRLWPCSTQGFDASEGRVRIHTDRGVLEAGYLVLATGMATKTLLPHLPIFPRSGQLIVTERSGEATRLRGALTAATYLMTKRGSNDNVPNPPIVVDPLDTGQYLIGSTREDGGDAQRTDFASVKRLLSHALACYTPLSRLRVIRVFSGVRAAVSDGLPIVGTLPEMPRVIVATGFEGDGICLAPLIGREVASLIGCGAVSGDLGRLSPHRFCEEREAV